MSISAIPSNTYDGFNSNYHPKTDSAINAKSNTIAATKKTSSEQNVTEAMSCHEENNTSSSNTAIGSTAQFASYEGIYHRATTAQGSTIAIDEKITTDSEVATEYSVNFERNNGQKINLSLTNDATISENEDGSLSVYSAQSNITTHYNLDGSSKEEAGNALKQSAHVTIINITSKDITAHSENATIFNFADNAQISTGDGNYNLYIDSKDAHINLGDGNAYIYADSLTNGSIHGGDGDISIEANSLKGTSIHLGDGNNNVDIYDVAHATITLGNGENTLQSDSFSSTTLTAGNGNNTLGIYSVHDSKIHTGDGDNYLNWSLSDNSDIRLGNGDNMINVAKLENSNLHTGNGENTYNNNYVEIMDFGVTAIEEGRTVNSTITLGNGNNTVNLISLENSTLNLGNGNNTTSSLFVDASTINLGEGLNAMYILGMHNSALHATSDVLFEAFKIQDSTINNKEGNTHIDAYEIENTALALGDGDNNVTSLYFKNSTANFGHGNNYFETHSMAENSQLTLGDGDNTLKIDHLKDTASIALGSGQNIYTITSADDGAMLGVNDEMQADAYVHSMDSDTILNADNFSQVHKKYKERSDDLIQTIFAHHENIVTYHKENIENMRGASFLDKHNAHVAKQQIQLSNLSFT